MQLNVLAVGAHPDDIEFMMAGTLLQLAKKGCKPHIFILATGSCGSAVTDREETVRIRSGEAIDAAETMGAVIYPPIVDDLEITYSLELLRKVAAVVRIAEPDIILTHCPTEYMEDHNATCRLIVTAAFARGMRNFVTDPPRDVVTKNVALYHSLPYGLRDSLNQTVAPDYFVDIESTLAMKKSALACHRSQKEWLDKSQGLDSYLISMENMSREIGESSGAFTYAEGWMRHNHLGFCGIGDNPLVEILGSDLCKPSKRPC